jgi:formylglycine-generating enzyme required for sulfatase activity
MRRFGFLTVTSIPVFISVFIGYAAATHPTGEMIFVPKGGFFMGSSPEELLEVVEKFGKRDLYKNYPFEEEMPKRKVFVASFYIDRHEVTNREYARFIKATGYRPPQNWSGGRCKSGKDDHPVLFVSQIDAMEYARWAGKRLPTEEEWEKAARGSLGLVYPWGNKFDPYKAATADSDLRLILDALCSIFSANKVELAPGDISPYGVHDMAGNVREWTSTTDPDSPSMVVVKGASWVDLSITARAANREYVPRGSISHIIGFRCVKDAGN